MFVVLLTTVCCLAYIYLRWSMSYWERKGFPYQKPHPLFGTLYGVVKREQSMGTAIYESYKNSKEKILGLYIFQRPMLLIRDTDLARDVLTKNFASFHDRGFYVDEENDPISGNLSSLKGKSWRSLRTKLSPCFSSGKLKAMFGTVEDVSIKMLNHLNTIVPEEGSAEIELRNIVATYAIDIIGSVILGLDVNSFNNPNNEFCTIIQKISTPALRSVIRNTAVFLHPGLEKLFISLGWREESLTMMRDLVEKTIKFRDQHNVVRKDMLQLLLQLRNTGKINEDDNVWTVEKSTDGLPKMSIDTISAQMMVFYAAGSDTTASAASFTLYELSQYPDILAKVQRDVDQALLKHDGKLTYEAIHDMKYLDLCIMETTRKYPGLPFLNRECTQDYPIPGTDKVIKKGTPIVISLLGLHRDEKNFADPLNYDPERFLEQNYNAAAYMPFGEGGRQCIAQRMGKVNVKVAIAQILLNFNIEKRIEKAEIEIDNFGFTILPKGGVNIRLSRRRKIATPF